jgi:hypothetical protein
VSGWFLLTAKEQTQDSDRKEDNQRRYNKIDKDARYRVL